MDSGEKRLNELGYKQELRREMTLFKTVAISFSTMTLFTGITPLFGSSFLYAGPAALVWGWVVASFFTWFVGIAMAEICSSFPTDEHYSPTNTTVLIRVVALIFTLVTIVYMIQKVIRCMTSSPSPPPPPLGLGGGGGGEDIARVKCCY